MYTDGGNIAAFDYDTAAGIIVAAANTSTTSKGSTASGIHCAAFDDERTVLIDFYTREAFVGGGTICHQLTASLDGKTAAIVDTNAFYRQLAASL